MRCYEEPARFSTFVTDTVLAHSKPAPAGAGLTVAVPVVRSGEN
jgi:hypothetical protein